MTVLDCGHAPSSRIGGGAGYGVKEDGSKHCYECCGKHDLKQMKETGKITLYFEKEQRRVVNWPSTISFDVTTIRESYHHLARVRYDYWFKLDGYLWHGYTVGDNTQIAHCKRTKTKC